MDSNENLDQGLHLRVNWSFVFVIIAIIFLGLLFQFFYHPKVITPDGVFPPVSEIPKEMQMEQIESTIPLKEETATTTVNTYKTGELPDNLKGFFNDKVELPK